MTIYRNNTGFTLLEVLLVLSLIGSLSLGFYRFSLSLFNWCQVSGRLLDCSRQQRSISLYLEEKIKQAVAVKVKDLDGDGEQELLLNLGDEGGPGDDTDEDTDYYLQFNVRDKCLTRLKTVGKFDDSGVSFPDWPDSGDWGYNMSVTEEIIEEHRFRLLETGLVEFSFTLEQAGKKHRLLNRINPYCLKTEGE